MENHKRKHNAVCVICGKTFYKRPSQNNNLCCSSDCKEIYMYNKGQFRLSAYCKENNISEIDFMSKIDTMHNKEMLSLKEISERLGIVRITLMRLCKKYNIHTRNISEDNARRYATMTSEEKKEQVRKANEGIRELFKDKEWKEKQINKVLSSQNWCSSKPELLFGEMLNDVGYEPERQYSKDLHGFSLDYAFPEIKLAIEIDGEYWHSLEKTKERDRRKDYLLKDKMGWEVIRIPAHDFELNPHHYIWEVIQTIEVLKIAS